MSIKSNESRKGSRSSILGINAKNTKSAAERWKNIRNYRFTSIISKM